MPGSPHLKPPTMRWVPLDKQVLLVASKDADDAWGLYVGAVEGKDYEKEAAGVVASGSGITHSVADVYFNDLTRNLMTKWAKQEHFFPDELVEEILRDKETFESGGSIPPIGLNILEANPIDKHVLLVAAILGPNDWVGYVGAVEGKDYDKEAAGVVANGSEIPFELAEIFFKDYTRNPELKYRHESQRAAYESRRRFHEEWRRRLRPR